MANMTTYDIAKNDILEEKENIIDWDSFNDKTLPFSLKGEVKEGKVVKVYDGDTVHIVFPIFNNMYFRWNCRINRVDTPELRTKNKLEKQMGYKVRDKLREKILNKIVTVKCDHFDKYGRLLAEIEIEGQNISDWLIENEYAFKYDGGTKKLWGPYLESKQEGGSEEA